MAVFDLKTERRGRMEGPEILALIFLRFLSRAVAILNCFFTLLTPNNLRIITHAFAFIRFWLFERTESGGKLSDQFLISARNGDNIFFGRDLQSLWDRDLHWVRESESKNDLATFDFRFKSNTFKNQFLFKQFVHAENHIGNVRSIGAPKSP